MINIYCGRGNIDREKFIYENVKSAGRETLIIVPEQYTLEAEKQALFLMNKKALIDVEVSSFSRLVHNLAGDSAFRNETFIDKTGKIMLLSRIMAKRQEDMEILGSNCGKIDFVETVEAFLSDVKKQNISYEELKDAFDGLDEDNSIKRKLHDVCLILRDYEEHARKCNYIDAEDLINLCISSEGAASYFDKKEVWIYGFDILLPKQVEFIKFIAGHAESVNAVIIYEGDYLPATEGSSYVECEGDEHGRSDFYIDRQRFGNLFYPGEVIVKELKKAADLISEDCNVRRIPLKYISEDRSRALRYLESRMFSEVEREDVSAFLTFGKSDKIDSINKNQSVIERDIYRSVNIVECSDYYSEAESAASFIRWLTGEKGLRYRDIVVFNQDADERESIVERVFDEYGIKIFQDERRSMLNSPVSALIVNTILCIAYNYRIDDVFKVLKSGFLSEEPFNLDKNRVNALERYCKVFKIKGSKWKKPFDKSLDMNEGAVAEEEYHQCALDYFKQVEGLYKKSRTVGDFLRLFSNFLSEKIFIQKKIEKLANSQLDEGMADKAKETIRIWDLILHLFAELDRLLGNEPFDGKEVSDLLTMGLKHMEIGIIPPSVDDVIIGTFGRTIAPDVKAVLVIGANEGCVPSETAKEELFRQDEVDKLVHDRKLAIRNSDLQSRLSIFEVYKNISKAKEYLWVSYSKTDGEGKAVNPSEITELMDNISGDEYKKNYIKVKDVLSRGEEDIAPYLGGKINTLRHFSQAIKKGRAGESISYGWSYVDKWLSENMPEEKQTLDRLFDFTNEQKDLDESLVNKLYSRNKTPDGNVSLSLSPSGLETFSRCPFSFFMKYGLKVKNDRLYAGGAPEIGDLYHKVFMTVLREVFECSDWINTYMLNEDNLRELIHREYEEIGRSYKLGVFKYSSEDKYIFKRAEENIFTACFALLKQAAVGKMESNLYEQNFGSYYYEKNPDEESGNALKALKPVEISLGNGKVVLKGQIDRVIFYPDNRVCIMDYKTGNEGVNIGEMVSGYRLQLMLYLKAVIEDDGINGAVNEETGRTSRDKEEKLIPGGVFYYNIKEQKENVKELPDGELYHNLAGKFKLNGIMSLEQNFVESFIGEVRKNDKGKTKDNEVISGISVEIEESDGIKTIVYKAKDRTSNVFIDDETFKELIGKVDKTVKRICGDLISGKISVTPMKTSSGKGPCNYCEYKSVCRFDRSYSGCKVVRIDDKMTVDDMQNLS